MKEKLEFVELLFADLLGSFKIHANNKETYERDMKKYQKGEVVCLPSDWNYMDKNYGKTSLKRKITLLRQELLNLERMLEE